MTAKQNSTPARVRNFPQNLQWLGAALTLWAAPAKADVASPRITAKTICQPAVRTGACENVYDGTYVGAYWVPNYNTEVDWGVSPVTLTQILSSSTAKIINFTLQFSTGSGGPCGAGHYEFDGLNGAQQWEMLASGDLTSTTSGINVQIDNLNPHSQARLILSRPFCSTLDVSEFAIYGQR